MRPVPPEAERGLGLRTYLTPQPGIGGTLRAEPEDFVVVELGEGPRRREGPYTAARIRLRNWETNRFVLRAAKELGIRAHQVAFAGMKDKRAVTEQHFTFRCPPDRLGRLAVLQDVQVLDAHATDERAYSGSHEGNRFEIRVRGARADAAALDGIRQTIVDEGGVPNFFGPQRFGAGVRPITHLVGQAIVAGDLEEAVRLYVGNPMEGEPEPTAQARQAYEDTRDPGVVSRFPEHLDLERGILERLGRRPEDWRHALGALPDNLLQLFVHAWQSYLFNHILSARLEAGLGLRTVHVGDRVMAFGDDGTRTVAVTASNQARVQREVDRGRAFLTGPLLGMSTPLAEDGPGAVERRVLGIHRAVASAFRCIGFPELASEGRRRPLLEPVAGLQVEDAGDPMFRFALGRGAYATVVLREFMKADLGSY